MIRCCSIGLLLLSLWLCSVRSIGQSVYFGQQPVSRAFVASDPGVVFSDDFSQLWLGGEDGLFRYAAGRRKEYPLPDGRAARVSAIFQAKDGILWVGYEDGTIAYLTGDRLALWLPEEGVPAASITAFAEDDADQLWLATYGEGLYCRSSTGRVFNIDTDDGLPGADVYDLRKGPKGEIWAGTDAGIARCSFGAGEKKEIRLLQPIDGLPDEIVLSFSSAEAGMWVGMHENGVAYFDLNTENFLVADGFASPGPVKQMLAGFNGEIFALSEDGTMINYRLDGKELKASDVTDVRSEAACLDREGNLWLLSKARDLYRGQLAFQFLPAPQAGTQAVVSDSDQHLWLGTNNGVILRREPQDTNTNLLPGSIAHNVLCLHEVTLPGKPGNESQTTLLLAGTFGQGLLVCTEGGCRQLGVGNGLTNENVFSIAGNADTAWLATLDGVFFLPLAELQKEQPQVGRLNDLGSAFFYQVRLAAGGGLWLATDGHGLLHYKAGKLTAYTEWIQGNDTLPVSTVLGVEAGDFTDLWVNTQEYGLLQFREGIFRAPDYESINLGGTGGISALGKDAYGALLVVYAEGVALLPETGQQWLRYGDATGFKEQGDALNAVTYDDRGNCWFVSGGSVVRYRSEPARSAGAVTVMAGITASGRELKSGEVRLQHNENNLVFTYRGNWLTDPEAVTYRYRLIGRDPDWIYSNDERATYSSLRPGNYVFELETGLYEQFQGAPDLIYTFVVLKPWWLRWWALVLFGVTIVSLTWFLANRRRRHREEVNQLAQDRVRNELAILKAQINPHFLFNSFSTLMATIEESQEMGIAYTEQLSNFFRYVLTTRDTELETLEREIGLLDNYYYLLKKRYGDRLTLEMQISDTRGRLPSMSLQTLLENAVKHNVVSARQPLHVTIVREGEHLVVTNPVQPKMKPEAGTGFGLGAIQRRYQLLGEKAIEVENNGVVFTVRLPIL